MPSRVLLAAGLIAVATILAYVHSFRVPLLFDDHRAIADNPSIHRLVPLGPVLTPPARSLLGSRPLANFSFALNYAAGGTAVAGYHAVNLALHVGAALLLFGILRRSLAGAGHRPGHFQAEEDALTFAAVIAALWALHPLLTASVTYLSQRTEVLMGCCYLGTLYGFIRGAEPERRGWLVISVVACLLGVLAKEVMVTAPLAVLLYDRTFVSGTFRAALQRRWVYYVALATSWLMLAIVMSRGLDETVGLNRGVSSWTYALTQCQAIATYFGRALWPQSLIFDQGETFLRSLSAALPYAWAPLALVAGCAMGVWRRSAAGFALGWIALTLAPTSSVIPITLQPLAENRFYLPLAGVVALGAVGLHRAIGRRALVVIAVLGLAALVQTIARNEMFRTGVSLWTDTVLKRPENARARLNLGQALMEVGRVPEAEVQYREALRLKPESIDGHVSYLSALFAAGRLPEAIQHGVEAVRLAPENALAHSNLAAAYLNSGRMDEGLRHLQAALRIEPALIPARTNLAIALTHSGRPQEALEHFAAVVQAGKATAGLLVSYGSALIATGHRAAALQQLQSSLTLDPNQPEALFRLGIVHFEDGRAAESIPAYQAALRLAPSHVDAHYCLGLAFAQLGRTAEAVAEFETTLRLKSDYEPARQQLARLRSK